MSEVLRRREAFERNKARGLSKPTERAKRDWLALSLSITSIMISFGGFYFNTLFQKDDIRVVIGSSPSVGRTEKDELTIYGEQELTFVNSGNRAAAITNVSAVGKRIDPAIVANECCALDEDTVMVFAFDVKPFVLKPGEIQTVRTQVTSEFSSKTDSFGVMRLDKSIFEAKSGDVVLACLNLNVVTPDSYSVQWRRPAYRMKFNDFVTETETLFEKTEPMSVLRRTSTIFNW